MAPNVQFISKDDGFAACGVDLCVTRDGGLTWTEIQAPFAFDPSQGGNRVLQFDFVDAQTGWAILITSDGRASFIKTTDGGQTWIAVKLSISL
jgi:photosystem II stability/assembly factor-like uncharacterized protein